MASSLPIEVGSNQEPSQQVQEDLTMDVSTQHFALLSWQDYAAEEQQVWLGKLGDRTSDFVDYSKKKCLYMKIGFALYCHPTQCDSGQFYESDRNEYILTICNKLSDLSQEIHSDGIYFSVLYIYCFVEESKNIFKKKEAQTFQSVVFKIRKGRHSREEYFLDSNLRVYDSWEKFRANNTFPQCWYALPKDGKYQADESGRVLLDIEKSPACCLKQKLLNIVDIGGVVLGVGGVVGSFVFPPASPFLIGSLVASGASGVFSGGRCIGKLADRRCHKQSLKDKEGLLLWFELSLSVATVGMSATSIVNSVRAAKASAVVNEVTTATTVGENTTSVVTEVASSTSNAVKGSQTAIKSGKNVTKAASKLGNATSKGTKVASKIGEATNKTVRSASISKGTKITSKAARGSRSASKLSNVARKGTLKTAKVMNAAKKSKKIASETVSVLKKTSKAAKIVDMATEKLSTLPNSVNAGSVITEEVTLLSNFKQFLSNIGSTGFKFIQTPSGIAVTTAGTAAFSSITTFALKIILQISVDYLYSNLSMKHKELLQEILTLITKIQNGTIDPLDITKFISFINFYFNTLVINHEHFIDNFIWRLYETASKWLTGEIPHTRALEETVADVGSQENQTREMSSATPGTRALEETGADVGSQENQTREMSSENESVQIWNSTISSNGNDIITNLIGELERADVDWSSVDFSEFREYQNLS